MKPPLSRENILEKVKEETCWDMIVIGGGASGLGIAVDAASRGYKVLLLEAYDFAKGTSSRSTKLIHGGLRYLKQGNIALVSEALKERQILSVNAPQLVSPLPFCVPAYNWWDGPFYGVGLKLYDLLAGGLGLKKSKHLSRQKIIDLIPNIEKKGLRGGILYYDAQFDDARLAITLMRTVFDQSRNSAVLNYAKVCQFLKKDQLIQGVIFENQLTNETVEAKGKVVINATGVFSDKLRQLDDKHAEEMVCISQGVHIAIPKEFMKTDLALIIPKTEDGRVLYLIPWLDKVLLGTTDTPMKEPAIEPVPLKQEIDFILKHVQGYLKKAPNRSDILSVFAGQRSLIYDGKDKHTSRVSREHNIMVSPSGLVSVCGGKWTTYRKVAEDVVNEAIIVGGLKAKPCRTEKTKLHGYLATAKTKNDLLVNYGSDREHIEKMIAKDSFCGELIHPNLPYCWGHILWGIQAEMAQTVEDLLARRTRSLFLNAKASIETAPKVAEILKIKLNKSSEWEKNQIKEFESLASQYLG